MKKNVTLNEVELHMCSCKYTCLAMSLTKWLRKTECDGSSSDQRALKAAADAVEAIQQELGELERKGRKRKSSEWHHYVPATKTVIGKYVLINGNKRAVQKFSASLGFAVSEATVCNFKREIDQQLPEGKEMEDIAIPARKRGRLLLLPEEIDELMKKFVLSLRHCGSPVS